jgi:hypothetical protein
MQQMMVHKDLEVVTSTTHFINTLQAYGVVLEVVVGRSTAMIAYESDILDGLYEWTAVLESEYQNQPQIRLTAFMIILTYIWRVTNNHFTALLRNPVVPPPRHNPSPHGLAGPSRHQDVHPPPTSPLSSSWGQCPRWDLYRHECHHWWHLTFGPPWGCLTLGRRSAAGRRYRTKPARSPHGASPPQQASTRGMGGYGYQNVVFACRTWQPLLQRRPRNSQSSSGHGRQWD